MVVETATSANIITAATVAAPDLMVLMGDAVADGGRKVLAELAANPATSVVPVALLQADATLDQRLRAFRSGAVAVIPRTASVDDIAKRVAELCVELPNRPGEAKGALGESTLDELVELVSQQLRTGILSVERANPDEKAPIRLVLGPGERVASALDEFVQHLKGLIAEAEPLHYELFEASGGRLRFLDDEVDPDGDLDVFHGLRVLVMDDDPGRADGLAAALRDHGSSVAVTKVSVEGLERAHRLDPAVVLLDSTAIEGSGFEVVRTMRRDPRLRWASILVLSWDEIWPKEQPSPDLEELATRLKPVVEPDEQLQARAQKEESFDTRLELTGPSRMLRTLVRVPGTRHLVVRSSHTILTVDLADGLIVSASGKTKEGEVEGTGALEQLLGLATGRVHVEKRLHPSKANVMMPVDEALAASAPRGVSVVPSAPPPPLVEDDQPPKVEEEADHDKSGPLFPPSERAASLSGSGHMGPATPSELSWGESPAESEHRHPFAEPEGSAAKPEVAKAAPEPKEPKPPVWKPKAPKRRDLAPPSAAIPRPSSETAGRKPPPPPGAPLEGAIPASPGSAGGARKAPPPPAVPPPAPASKPLGKRRSTREDAKQVSPESAVSAAAESAPQPKRRSKKKTMVGMGISAPPPASAPPADDGDAPTLIRDSKALAAELAAAGGAEAEELGQQIAQQMHTAPTVPPPSDELSLNDEAEDEVDLAIGEPVSASALPQPAAAQPSPPGDSGPPAGVVGEPLQTYEATLTEDLDPDAMATFRKKRGAGGTLLVVGVALVSVLGVAWIAAWRFAPELLPPWAGGQAPVVAEVEPEPDPNEATETETESEPESESEPEPESASESEPESEGDDDQPSEEEMAEDGDPEAMSDRERDDRSDHLARIARRMLDDGNVVAARRYANRALRMHDRNPQALAAKAHVHIAAGEGEAAVHYAVLATRMRSRRARYQVLLGDAYRVARQGGRSRRAYRKALELDPDNREARRRLGQ